MLLRIGQLQPPAQQQQQQQQLQSLLKCCKRPDRDDVDDDAGNDDPDADAYDAAGYDEAGGAVGGAVVVEEEEELRSPAAAIGRSVTGIGEPLRKQMRLAATRRRPSPTRDMCADNWRLDETARSHETVLLTPTSVLFHPRWSNGHAAVRASRPLDRGLVHYWEVTFGDRVFGTAMQVGLCTAAARLHANEFLGNLVGQDANSWGLSHQGVAWHDGTASQLCEPFAENQACAVGVLFDGPRGTVAFYKDGRCLGAPFGGLGDREEPLYPVLSSTAAKTSMTVSRQLRSYASLQDRCCAVLARTVLRTRLGRQTATELLPPPLRRLLTERFFTAATTTDD